MLRLRPSSIVLTHEEVKKALETALPAVGSPSSPDSLAWDHNITNRRQTQKGKQREERSPVEQALAHQLQTLNLHPDDDGYNAGAEEDVLGDESTTAESDIEDELPTPGAVTPISEGFPHSRDGPAELHGQLPLVGRRSVRSRNWMPSSLIDGASSRDDAGEPGWEVHDDNYDRLIVLYDSDYQADGETEAWNLDDTEDLSPPESEDPYRHLRPRNLDGASDTEPGNNSRNLRTRRTTHYVLQDPDNRRGNTWTPVLIPPVWPQTTEPWQLAARHAFDAGSRHFQNPFEPEMIPALSPEGTVQVIRYRSPGRDLVRAFGTEVEDMMDRNSSPDTGRRRRLFSVLLAGDATLDDNQATPGEQLPTSRLEELPERTQEQRMVDTAVRLIR